jgi:transcriptional regulator with XRE-family HTH domain
MGKNPQFGDQLRAAVLNAGESRYRISKATGISESILSRFVRGEAGLSMEYANRLCEYLGLRLEKAEKAGPSKSKRKGK